MTGIRRLRFAALAAFTASAIVTSAITGVVTVHSWRDITIGSDTSYCGVAAGSGSVTFYCEEAT